MHESPSLSTEKHSFTIADVDAEELFSNFSKIVIVTEEEEEFEPVTPYRTLNFGEDAKVTNKLNFDQSTASMKKKKNDKSKNTETIELRPFKIMD